MDKLSLRREIRTIKRQFSASRLEELSLGIIRRLTAHPRFLAARTILLYASLPDEVNTHPLLERLSTTAPSSASLPSIPSFPATPKTILLPRVTGPAEMELRLYRSPSDLTEGSFGIMEPTGPLFTDHSRIDLAIIPGMAFDRHCHRLGRGKGYYDRFLSLTPDVYKIGICFPFQMVDEVPVEPTDIAMNEVISL